MTDEAKALVERLRGDWPEILVEKHWMMDSDAIDAQRADAADRIEALSAENERLREALIAEREENLWNAYATGDTRGDEWTHLYMSDGEWLVRQCGFDPKQGYYKAEEIRNAIPIAARAALGETK
jgi:hypothetical protein